MGSIPHALFVAGLMGLALVMWSWRHRFWVICVVLVSLVWSIARPGDGMAGLLLPVFWFVPAMVAVAGRGGRPSLLNGGSLALPASGP